MTTHGMTGTPEYSRIKWVTIKARLRNGWTPDDAVKIPTWGLRA